MIKREQIYTNKWRKISWSNYLLGCCDCNLIHSLDFRVIGQELQMKVKLCPKLTKEARKTK